MKRTPPTYADVTIERTNTGSYRLTGGYGGSLPTRSNRVTTIENVTKRLTSVLGNKGKDMIVYILQVSDKPPTQFKIRVLNAPVDAGMHSIKQGMAEAIDEKGFRPIGTYATPEELTAALEPYLHMEEGK